MLLLTLLQLLLLLLLLSLSSDTTLIWFNQHIVLLQGSQIGHFVTKLKLQTRSFAATECHSLLWPKATYRRTYVIIIRGMC